MSEPHIFLQPLETQKNALFLLIESLKKASTVEQKQEIVAAIPIVIKKFNNLLPNFTELDQLSSLELLCIKSLLVLDQEAIFHPFPTPEENNEALQKLVNQLVPIETFYRDIGGIIGYHHKVISLIIDQYKPCTHAGSYRYLQPTGTDFTQKTDETRHMIRVGIEKMETLGEIYPVGGAGDRLNLKDSKTDEALPAAQLPFCGRTLLEGLFRDLQGREYLYYKLYHKQLHTPVAMMTSEEKNNHQHILQICEKKKWFNRPKDSFFLFVQPLVPVITQDGRWGLKDRFSLILKPGGHGVIWKLAKDSGLFNWFRNQGRYRALVRQINNPIAGTDDTLLGFLGVGFHGDKSFGFASCPRYLNTAEGMDVLLEEKTDQGYCYCTTNVEYTEFKKHGLEDVPKEANSPFSAFPANTNILFANLEKLSQIVEKAPLPGQLVNLKSKVKHANPDGSFTEIYAGRLETTMQNIADEMQDCFPTPLQDFTSLQTYLTYHERAKTISVTKHSLVSDGPTNETPERCFYDLILNMQKFLEKDCHFETPSAVSYEEYLKKGPHFTALFHPALGPLYSIIAQKIQGGKLYEHAELILEIAELEMRNVKVRGSLQIIANQLLGHQNTEGQLHYSEKTGKCTLRNVEVINEGLNLKDHNVYWKQKIDRLETMEIVIHGNGEFIAENVIFQGPFKIEVPNGIRIKVQMDKNQMCFERTPIQTPTWYWQYVWGPEDKIRLIRHELPASN